MVAALPFDVDSPVDVPLCPPRHWFEEVPDHFDPRDGLIQIELDGPDAGRVVALVAPEGEQILRDDIAWQPPQSPTNYEFAHAGTTLTAEGEKIRTANIGGNINHAPGNYAMRAAVDLYANTATRTMRCRYHDVPGVGVVAVGALWPGLSKRDAITAMGMAISGDWRHVASLGTRDLAGSQLVNAPALRPLPHGAKRIASYRPARFLPVAAGLGGTDDVVFGTWEFDDPGEGDTADMGLPSFAAAAPTALALRPASELEERLSRVEAALAVLIANDVADVPFPDDDDGWGGEHDGLFRSVFGCKACAGHGGGFGFGGGVSGHACPMCHGSGVEPYNPFDDLGFEFVDVDDDGDVDVVMMGGGR